MLSIPRDLWVNIPDIGQNRINAAHFFAENNQPGSGPLAALETVRQNFGIDISYFVRIRFDGLIDVVEWREVMSEQWGKKVDVAIVEGSNTDPHAAARIKKIRDRAKIVIAYGSCATIGGVNGMKNNFPLDEIKHYVYGDGHHFFATEKTKAIHQVVQVDYFVHGCPVYIPEFVTVLKTALRAFRRLFVRIAAVADENEKNMPKCS